MLGVDCERRAAAPDFADDLAGIARTLFDRRGARVGRLAIVVAVAVGAAGADRKRARRVRGANRGDQMQPVAKASADLCIKPIMEAPPKG